MEAKEQQCAPFERTALLAKLEPALHACGRWSALMILEPLLASNNWPSRAFEFLNPNEQLAHSDPERIQLLAASETLPFSLWRKWLKKETQCRLSETVSGPNAALCSPVWRERVSAKSPLGKDSLSKSWFGAQVLILQFLGGKFGQI